MAVPDLTLELLGADGFEENLIELSRLYGPRSARQTFNVPMRRAFSFVEEEIRAETPVDTGNLQDHTELRAGVANRFEMRQFPDAVFAARAGWFYSSPNTLTFQALAVEFGTRYQPAQRVLRNALDDNINIVLDVFVDEMRESLDRTARRLHRRQSAGLHRRR